MIKINIESIAQRLQVENDFVLKLINNYLLITEEEIKGLEKSIKTKDHKQIYQHAHKIKGGSINLDFQSIHDIALEIEENATLKNDIDYNKMLSQIKDNFLEIKNSFM